jgi:hypothetical protein
VACLRGVRAWSNAHPGHVPLAVLLELKDTPLPPEIPATVPVPWTSAQMDGLDTEIRSVFLRGRIVAPDDVRDGRATLEAAVLRGRWPTLAAARGKVLFLLDNGEPYRSQYLAGHASLRGRVAFTNSTPGQPDAAFIKANDPTGANVELIRDLVRRGYVVRTRADADTREARADDPTRRRLALASGAQWVSTDYPAPGIAARFGSRYRVRVPGPGAARCNPVNAPRGCAAKHLERVGSRGAVVGR